MLLDPAVAPAAAPVLVSTPTLVSPPVRAPRHRPRALTLELATSSCETPAGPLRSWALVGTGLERSGVLPLGAARGALPTLSELGLDALPTRAVLHTGPQPRTLRAAARLALRAAEGPHGPGALGLSRIRSRHHARAEALAQRAAARAASASAPDPASAADLVDRVEVACDGSWFSSGTAGLAWVSSSGRWGSSSTTTERSELAELAALELALAAHDPAERLRVLLDCTAALDLARVLQRDPDRAAPAHLRLAALLTGRDVVLAWVRGHARHPLNSAADQLARAEARALERGTSGGGPAYLAGAHQRLTRQFGLIS